MPLYKSIQVDAATKVLIWKIEESFDTLCENLQLTERCNDRIDHMKSEIHRRGFLSVRQLLKAAGYDACDLYYDENGKPHLKDEKYISISHSFEFAGIIISDKEVGIDIEKQRDKILKIAHKFTILKAYRTLANEDALIRKLTMVWCAKESLYKIYATPGLSFLQHIDVYDFDMEDLHTKAAIQYHLEESTYHITFSEFEGFTCAYAIA